MFDCYSLSGLSYLWRGNILWTDKSGYENFLDGLGAHVENPTIGRSELVRTVLRPVYAAG
jgi:hypothetical protein